MYNLTQQKKIGLLTPYTGDNLGDGAIQEAVIQNIRKRWPDAKICGFTLYPERTEERHRIPCYPIIGNSLNYYGPPPCAADSTGSQKGEGPVKPNISMTVRRMIKRFRPVYRALKIIHESSRVFLKEIRHIVSSRGIIKGFDILIVSGGGQLDDYWGGPWGHPYALFKWGLLARMSGIDYVFLSVGVGSLDAKLSRLFIRTALKLSSYRSYRDQTSKDIIAGVGPVRGDPVFPDLAFSYSLPKGERRAVTKRSKGVVGVSPITYLHPHRWPRADQAIYDGYMDRLVIFVSSLLREGYSIVFFSTDSPDRDATKDVIRILNDQVDFSLTDKIEEVPAFTVEDIFTYLQKVDYVVTSRLHGVLLSHLAGKPVLAISYDRKVDTYMEEMNQSEYCIDIHNFDESSLIKKFRLLEANAPDIQSLIERKVLREQTRAGYSV